MVWAARNRSGIMATSFLGFGSLMSTLVALYQAAEALDLFVGKAPELAGLQGSQLQKSDLNSTQLLHKSSEVLEHHPDLILTAFDQADFVPGIFFPPDQFQSRGRRHSALHGNTAPKLLFLCGGKQTRHLHQVVLRDV